MNQERMDASRFLKIAKGQIEATIRMLEDDRYCIDISNQILATQSLLKKADLLIIRQHLTHCVKDALQSDQGDEKIDEIMKLLEKTIGK